jgi:cysteine desulfurase/selenocysteine lyase
VVPGAEVAAAPLDVAAVRGDFPILARRVHGRPLVYLDNAATTQKPAAVLAAVDDFYRQRNANVHRAIHTLGEEATRAYEGARAAVARHIGARAAGEVVFVRNATEALNLVALAWARPRLRPGDEILLTPMEHHSNLVPWQLVAKETGARLRFIPLSADGRLDLEAVRGGLLGPRTRVLAFTHCSNVLGTITPAAELCRLAREAGAVSVVDAAQSVPHLPVDVGALGCDFLAFSGHKAYAPLGIGVLWGRAERLADMEPLFGGGEMILRVELESSTWNEVPWRFEAGTPNVAGAVGLAAACAYLQGLGMERIAAHEAALTARALELLSALPGVRVYGPGPGEPRGALVAFQVEGVHPHDLAQYLDQEGVAIRAGHHCAQPLMRALGVVATARASFALYNTEAEVEALEGAVRRARGFFHA